MDNITVNFQFGFHLPDKTFLILAQGYLSHHLQHSIILVSWVQAPGFSLFLLPWVDTFVWGLLLHSSVGISPVDFAPLPPSTLPSSTFWSRIVLVYLLFTIFLALTLTTLPTIPLFLDLAFSGRYFSYKSSSSPESMCFLGKKHPFPKYAKYASQVVTMLPTVIVHRSFL